MIIYYGFLHFIDIQSQIQGEAQLRWRSEKKGSLQNRATSIQW